MSSKRTGTGRRARTQQKATAGVDSAAAVSRPDSAAGARPDASSPGAPTPENSAPETSTPGTSTPDTAAAAGGRRRRRAGSTGRWAAGILVLACGGALVAGSSLAAAGTGSTPVEVPFAEVPAGPLTGVCAEPPRLLSGNVAGTDAEFSAESTSARSVVNAAVLAAAGTQLPAAGLSGLSNGAALAALSSGDADAVPLAGTRPAAVKRDQPVSAASLLSAEPTGALQATAGAGLTYSADDGDLKGLAAANCRAPSNDQWFVGARTTVGATAVLQLSNPSQTTADVDLELYGTAGPLDGPGSRGISVAPGQTRNVVLAGLAANQESLAVRVRSSGGPVAAVIAQNLLRGLTPGGVELIQPTTAPGPDQVISGVRIQNPDATRKLANEDGYGSVLPSLQVAVPGAGDAVVNLRVFGPGGEVRLEGGGSYNVAAGTVSRIPLEALPEGTYTLDISADSAVAAAAVFSRGSDPEAGTDFAVAAAGERLGSEHLAVLPSSDSVLSFTAPSGEAEVRLTGVDANGALLAEKTFPLTAGTAKEIKPSDLGGSVAAVLVHSTGAPVYGAQSVTGGETGISALTLPRGNVGGSRVQVGVGY